VLGGSHLSVVLLVYQYKQIVLFSVGITRASLLGLENIMNPVTQFSFELFCC